MKRFTLCALILAIGAGCGADDGNQNILNVRLTLNPDSEFTNADELTAWAEVTTTEYLEADAEARAAATEYREWQESFAPPGIPAACDTTAFSDDEPPQRDDAFLPLPEVTIASGTLRAAAAGSSVEFNAEDSGTLSSVSSAQPVDLTIVGDGDFAEASATYDIPAATGDYDIALTDDIVSIAAGATPVDLRVEVSNGLAGFDVKCDELAGQSFTLDLDALGWGGNTSVLIRHVSVDEEYSLDVGPENEGNVTVVNTVELLTELREGDPI